MRMGPQIECQGCRMPILLSFAERDGSVRVLTCPYCEHTHLWVIADVRGPAAGGAGEDGSRSSAGSSVE
jgi:hypothetical protein